MERPDIEGVMRDHRCSRRTVTTLCDYAIAMETELDALRARLAPSQDDEQRAREIAGRERPNLKCTIAQALGAAREQGAEGERGRTEQMQAVVKAAASMYPHARSSALNDALRALESA